jgi:hypothetical protein
MSHQALFETRVGSHLGHRECEQSDAAARFFELVRTVRASLEVLLDGLALFALHHAKSVEVEVFFPSWMPVHGLLSLCF